MSLHPSIRVVRGDELLTRAIRPGVSTHWWCRAHGYVKPREMLAKGEVYTVCWYCVEASDDIKPCCAPEELK